jgi:hypothetical protein
VNNGTPGGGIGTADTDKLARDSEDKMKRRISALRREKKSLMMLQSLISLLFYLVIFIRGVSGTTDPYIS